MSHWNLCSSSFSTSQHIIHFISCLLNEMVKCIRRAVIFGVSYTQTLHLQKYFTYGRGFNLSLNFTDMDATDRTEAISRSLVSSRGLGRSAWKWAVIEVDKWKRRKMTESLWWQTGRVQYYRWDHSQYLQNNSRIFTRNWRSYGDGNSIAKPGKSSHYS